MLELLSLQLGVFKAHLSALLLKYKDVAGGQAKHGAFPTLAQSRLPHLLIPAPTDPSPWDRLFSSGAAAAPRAFRAPVGQGVTARGQNGEFGPQTPGFSHHFHAVRLHLQVLSLHSCSAWAEVVEQCLFNPFSLVLCPISELVGIWRRMSHQGFIPWLSLAWQGFREALKSGISVLAWH